MNRFLKFSTLVVIAAMTFISCSDDDGDNEPTPYDQTLIYLTNNSTKSWQLIESYEDGEDVGVTDCYEDDIYLFNVNLSLSVIHGDNDCDSNSNEDYSTPFSLTKNGKTIILTDLNESHTLSQIDEDEMTWSYKGYDEDIADTVLFESVFKAL